MRTAADNRARMPYADGMQWARDWWAIPFGALVIALVIIGGAVLNIACVVAIVGLVGYCLMS